MYLYHYTSEEGLECILHERIVRVSGDDNRPGTNARYGTGVYLTAFSPDKEKVKIQRNNYDGAARNPSRIRKTECYLKFGVGRSEMGRDLKFNKEDLPNVCKEKIRNRSIWRNPNEINLRNISFCHGYTDTGSAGEICVQCPVHYQFIRDAIDFLPHSATRAPLQQHTLAISEFVNAFSTYGSDDEDEDNYINPDSWGSTSVQRQSYGRSVGSFQDQENRYRTPSSSPRPSQQQDAQGSGVGTAIAGTAAAVAIGAAVLGLFSAYQRQNNQK